MSIFRLASLVAIQTSRLCKNDSTLLTGFNVFCSICERANAMNLNLRSPIIPDLLARSQVEITLHYRLTFDVSPHLKALTLQLGLSNVSEL